MTTAPVEYFSVSVQDECTSTYGKGSVIQYMGRWVYVLGSEYVEEADARNIKYREATKEEITQKLAAIAQRKAQVNAAKEEAKQQEDQKRFSCYVDWSFHGDDRLDTLSNWSTETHERNYYYLRSHRALIDNKKMLEVYRSSHNYHPDRKFYPIDREEVTVGTVERIYTFPSDSPQAAGFFIGCIEGITYTWYLCEDSFVVYVGDIRETSIWSVLTA